MSGLVAAGLATLVLGASGPTGTPSAGGEVAPAHSIADTLQVAAVVVANLWARGEADSVGFHFASAGVRVALPEGERGLLERKPAVAVLEALFRGARVIRVRVRRVDEVGGSPSRGFAELQWEYRIAGMPEVTTRTVYLGFTRQEERWWITEIRVFD